MKSESIELRSTITCPHCGHAKEETMPTDACMYFYVCEECDSRFQPTTGDCCVFCSYGTVKCPPIQAGGVAQDSVEVNHGDPQDRADWAT